MDKFKYGVAEVCDEKKHADWFSLLAVGSLVFLIVGGIVYAIYIFIGATRISDASGVHITKNLSLAVDDLRGRLYTDQSRDIKDWMIHNDQENGFNVKHPNDWEMQENTSSFLLLKKYKDSSAKNSSLLVTLEIASIPLEKGQSLRDAALKKGIVWKNSWKEEFIGGRMGVKTGKVKTVDGLDRDAIFWNDEQAGRVFYMEITYFTSQALELENIFTKIIAEFKFI